MTRDGLTGAFNKSYLLDSLSQEIARSQRCNRQLCVLLMDIDHFKKVNDTYGHLVGDEVLREFSKRIAQSKRDDDLLCRYGGEDSSLSLAKPTWTVQFTSRKSVIVQSPQHPLRLRLASSPSP